MADSIPISNQVISNTLPIKGRKVTPGPSDVCLNPQGSIHTGQGPDQVASACQDFEAVLVSYLLKTMRQSVPQQGWLENQGDTDFYRGLMEWEVAVQASRQNRFGLWKSIYRQVTGNDPDSVLSNPNHQVQSSQNINKALGGPSEKLGNRIANHSIRGVGSSRPAEQTSENSSDPDSP